MNTADSTPVTALAPEQRAASNRRGALRRATDAACPDNCVWLGIADLAHPEAERNTGALPLPLAVGRVRVDGRMRGVREADLVVARLLAAGSPPERLRAELRAYGHFVARVAPTQHARLTGRVLADWLARRSATR